MKRINHIFFWLLVLGLSVYAFVRVNDTGRKLPRTPWSIPVASAKTWDETLAHPVAVSFTVLETGTLRTKRSGFINLKHRLAKNLKNEELEVPVKAYLVKHPTRGAFLLEAGFDRLYAVRPQGSMQGLSAPFIPWSHQSQGQDAFSHLAADGTTLTGFFFTHLHFDHIAGAKDFPLSTLTLAAGEREPYLNIQHLIGGNHFAQAKVLHEISFAQAGSMPPFGPAVDLFGDGSLWAISTPGHTRGHVSYLVNAQSGAVLVTGDACNLREQLSLGVGPGAFSSDLKLAQTSLEAIKTFHEKYPKVRVEVGHEK